MIIDAETLEGGEVMAAGVCVVGGGPAGITLALGLAERGVEVLLLESGGFEVEDETELLNQGTMSGLDNWSLDSHRRRLLGGATLRWGGWTIPLRSHDFEPRSHVPYSGWPIELADLEPHLEQAHRRVELADPLWDTESLSAASGRPLVALPGGRGEIRAYQFSPPTRFGTKYRADLEEAPEITVYVHATVVEIRLDTARERVASLRCATLGGVEFEVEPSYCVLALGGIENARLLLASNEQLAAGVANSSDAVGRYFMEHPHFSSAMRLRSPDGVDLSFFQRHTVTLPRGSSSVETELRGIFALKSEVLKSEGLLDVVAAVELQDPEPGLTGELEGSEVQAFFAPAGDAIDHRLYLRCEQSPHPESRITLTDEVDALGVPRADLHWVIQPEDWTKYTRAAEILGTEMAAAGLGRAWIQREDGVLFHNPAPGGHHMGTTRMSSDPREGVVDANCRAHDVENLYIAGSSVFTTAGASHPTLTIVTLAERLAAHLAEEAK